MTKLVGTSHNFANRPKNLDDKSNDFFLYKLFCNNVCYGMIWRVICVYVSYNW